MMKADIGVFACTGHVGTRVARCITKQTSSGPLKVVLAGRDPEKVKALHEKLMGECNNPNVMFVSHQEPVDVTNEEALRVLIEKARVVINCIDVDCHPMALVGVAEACTKAGTHYLDLAPSYSHLQALFALNDNDYQSKSIIVPSSAFDYCLIDLAELRAEQAFASRYPGSKLHHVQMTMAVRTGPQGIKWPLHLVSNFLEGKTGSAATSKPRPQKSLAPPAKLSHVPRSAGSILAYVGPLKAWSIRLPMGADAVAFLLSQRHWSSGDVDVRLALPKSLWKAACLVIYGTLAAVVFLPLLATVRYLHVRVLHKLLLWILPLFLPVFTDDYEACERSREQMAIELVILLTSKDERSLCYHVKGPSPEVLNPLCLSLTALELAKMPRGNGTVGGVMTPAQAVGDTGLWGSLLAATDVTVEIAGE